MDWYFFRVGSFWFNLCLWLHYLVRGSTTLGSNDSREYLAKIGRHTCLGEVLGYRLSFPGPGVGSGRSRWRSSVVLTCSSFLLYPISILLLGEVQAFGEYLTNTLPNRSVDGFFFIVVFKGRVTA